MSKVLPTLALLCVAPSCAWNSEWVFGATRASYGDGPEKFPPVSAQSGGAKEAGQVVVLAVGFLLLPVIVDLAFLPIEWTHDQVVLD